MVKQNLFYQNWDGVYVHHLYTVYTDISLINNHVDYWVDNRQGDPIFHNPAGPDRCLESIDDNDFSLQPGSAAVDLVSAVDPRLDILSMQRPSDGDGDLNGIAYHDAGAWEFMGIIVLDPSSDTTWVANNVVQIRWSSSLKWSGTAVAFELWRRGLKVRDLGVGWDPSGSGVASLPIPTDLVTGGDYRLRAVSSWDPGIVSWSPAKISIDGPDPNDGETMVLRWEWYE